MDKHRIHRFEQGKCRKCGMRESTIKNIVYQNVIHGNKFVQHTAALIRRHPDREEELLEASFPCSMTDDEFDIKDIIE